MKIDMAQILALILLIGSFLYIFEIFYHGFEIGDLNPDQVLLTFAILIISSSFLFGYEIMEKRISKKALVGLLLFLAMSVAFLFLVFFPRSFNQSLSLAFAVAYFLITAVLLLKNNLLRRLGRYVDIENPLIKFSYRFFVVLGIIILPASFYQYAVSGSFDFSLSSIYMPMIDVITFLVRAMLGLMGIATVSTSGPGGYTLSVPDGSYSVFVGALCSGVTSMSVFIAAFIAMAWDNRSKPIRKLAIFAVGVIGTFVSNVFRVLMLFLVGLYYGIDVLMAVHTHLGWILYFVWIAVFWIIAFRFLETRPHEGNKLLAKHKFYI